MAHECRLTKTVRPQATWPIAINANTPIMKTQRHYCLAACAIFGSVLHPIDVNATVLRSNDVIVFQFSSLAWTQVSSSLRPNPFVDQFYNGSTGDSFRMEFFEDSTLQPPFHSYTNYPSLPGTNQETQFTFNYPPAYQKWLDRQGIVRFTGLSGTILLTNITIQIWDGTNVYRQILPIPQPQLPNGSSVQIMVSPAMELSWPTHSTNRYQIQWSSSLNTNDWFDFDSPIQGTGNTNYYLISTRGAEKRFYRVVTLSP